MCRYVVLDARGKRVELEATEKGEAICPRCKHKVDFLAAEDKHLVRRMGKLPMFHCPVKIKPKMEEPKKSLSLARAF